MAIQELTRPGESASMAFEVPHKLPHRQSELPVYSDTTTQIFYLAAMGYGNGEIAAYVDKSLETVNNRIRKRHPLLGEILKFIDDGVLKREDLLLGVSIDRVSILTEKEEEVLNAFVSNPDVCDKPIAVSKHLGLTERAVSRRIESVYKRWGLKSLGDSTNRKYVRAAVLYYLTRKEKDISEKDDIPADLTEPCNLIPLVIIPNLATSKAERKKESIEMLKFLALGKSYKDILKEVAISRPTLTQRVRKIKEESDSSSIFHAIKTCLEEGKVNPQDLINGYDFSNIYLSPREREIMEYMIAEGANLSNQKIAERLGLKEHSLNGVLLEIVKKFGVQNVLRAKVVYYLSNTLFPIEESSWDEKVQFVDFRNGQAWVREQPLNGREEDKLGADLKNDEVGFRTLERARAKIKKNGESIEVLLTHTRKESGITYIDVRILGRSDVPRFFPGNKSGSVLSFMETNGLGTIVLTKSGKIAPFDMEKDSVLVTSETNLRKMPHEFDIGTEPI